MGAIEESNAIFLSISNGKICRRVGKPTAASVTRVNKMGNTVHEEFKKGWKGLITGIAVREHKEYGKFWNITMTDQDGDAIIQMNYSSGYSAAFLKALPNVDLKSEVIFTPNMKIEGEKKKATVFLTQHGIPVKWFFTKDNPNGLPQLKQIKVKGKLTYDDSEIMEFLEHMVMTSIVPKLPKGATPAASAPVDEDNLEEEAEKVKDKLPF